MALAFREWILTFLFIEPPFRKSWPCNHFRTRWIILTSQDFLLSRSTIAFSFPEDLSNALFSRHSFPEDLPQHYSDSARCSVGWCLFPFLVQEHICAFFATSFHSIILLNKCGLHLKYFNWKLYKKLCFFFNDCGKIIQIERWWLERGFGEMVRKKLDKLLLTPSRSCTNMDQKQQRQ